MSEDLKSTTAKSLIWNALDKVGFQVVALVVGIITARLLSREDFGYIAALAMFTMLSSILVESGFTSALVRRKVNTREDYSGAFFFNLFLSTSLYLILYFSAPFIADYFKMPVLCDLARVLFLAIIISSFGIVPTIILTKNFKFKYLSISNLLGVFLSAVITIYMAMNDYAYWAIAAQQLTQVGFRVVFVWIFSKWRPSLRPNFAVVWELFSFSVSLIITSIINTCVRYVYNFIIGPQYSAAQLGCYGQAYKFQNIATTVISSTLTGVAYPVISSLNEEKERQVLYLRKLMRICAFSTFPVLIGLLAVAENFITVVITDKWLPMLPYFRILLLSGAVLPFMNFALNAIIALGKPNINMYVQLVKNALIIALVIVMNDTIEIMLWGFFIANFVGYILSIVCLGRYMKYSVIDHIKDIAPYLVLSICMLLVIAIFTHFVSMNIYLTFALQIILGATFYLGTSMLMGSQIIKDIRQIIIKK